MRKFLSEELLAAEYVLKRCIAEHKHGHHDEMKTSTEYRKCKHRMKTNRLKKLNRGN